LANVFCASTNVFNAVHYLQGVQLSVLWMKSTSDTIMTKIVEQHLLVVLFTVLMFESVDEILICDRASETLFRKCFQFGALPT